MNELELGSIRTSGILEKSKISVLSNFLCSDCLPEIIRSEAKWGWHFKSKFRHLYKMRFDLDSRKPFKHGLNQY